MLRGVKLKLIFRDGTINDKFKPNLSGAPWDKKMP